MLFATNATFIFAAIVLLCGIYLVQTGKIMLVGITPHWQLCLYGGILFFCGAMPLAGLVAFSLNHPDFQGLSFIARVPRGIGCGAIIVSGILGIWKLFQGGMALMYESTPGWAIEREKAALESSTIESMRA